jgi:hypothetical protein
MPDLMRARRGRRSRAWLALAAALVLAATPGAVLGGGGPDMGASAPGGGARVEALAPPAETCRPEETMRAGGFSDICGNNPGGGGGPSLGALLSILGVVVIGGVVALIAAFVVLRRTSAPLVPADPGEWWTCRNCGKTNVVGSARCYACGAWPR